MKRRTRIPSLYCRRLYQKFHEKADNSGAGYRITAVDDEAGTITVDGSIAGWGDGDQLDAWLPTAKPIGDPIESRSVRVFVDGKTGRFGKGLCPSERLQSSLRKLEMNSPVSPWIPRERFPWK